MASDRIRAYPASGKKIRDPRTGRPVPGSQSRVGEKLSESEVRKPEDFARDYPREPYWVRRVRSGDMVEVPPRAPAKPAPRKKE